MLFADFGAESGLQLSSLAMAQANVSHPPLIPRGFLPVEVSDGAMAPANGRSAMPPRLRPRVAIQRTQTPLFGAFGTTAALQPKTASTISVRTSALPSAIATLPSTQALPPLIAPAATAPIPSPVDPYGPAPGPATHWGWWVLAGVGALGAIGGVFLLLRR